MKNEIKYEYWEDSSEFFVITIKGRSLHRAGEIMELVKKLKKYCEEDNKEKTNQLVAIMKGVVMADGLASYNLELWEDYVAYMTLLLMVETKNYYL